MKYAKSRNGIVHLINVFGGEHTLCGWAFDVSSEPEDAHHAWESVKRGPVSCPRCALIIESCRGVRCVSVSNSRG